MVADIQDERIRRMTTNWLDRFFIGSALLCVRIVLLGPFTWEVVALLFQEEDFAGREVVCYSQPELPAQNEGTVPGRGGASVYPQARQLWEKVLSSI